MKCLSDYLAWRAWTPTMVLVALGTVLAGCSDVAFSPGPADNSSQGPISPGPRTEVFNFNDDRPLTKVDVLFVVDNSGSMAEEQAKLAPRLASFVNSIAAIDWQIGITTTDVDSRTPYNLGGSLVNFVGTNSHILSKSTPNYERAFLDTVIANGTPPAGSCGSACPSGEEQPLRATKLAIDKRNGVNAGFFREAADFAAVVLSDENELSDGQSKGGVSPLTPQDLLSHFERTFGAGKLFTGFGIIVRPGDQDCRRQSVDHNYGTFVQMLADLTEGVTGSICANDYGPTLANIGQRVRKTATSIRLAATPVPGSVVVTLTPADPMITWEITGAVVRLSDLPQRGSKLVVTYTAQ